MTNCKKEYDKLILNGNLSEVIEFCEKINNFRIKRYTNFFEEIMKN